MKARFKGYLILLVALTATLLPGSVAENPSMQLPGIVHAQDPGTNRDKSNQRPRSDSEAEVVRVETDLVTTLFTAVDKDRQFITILHSEDLKIMEDGVEQQITLFERETDRPLTMVVLVDTSRSQERTLPDEKHAAKRFVEAVVRPDKDKLAVVSFTGRPRIDAPLGNDVCSVSAAIDRLEVEFPPGGCDVDTTVEEDARCWTSIWDSVLACAKGLLAPTRKGTRRAIILLSDGDDTSSKVERDEAIKAAVQNDVVIYGIGIGDPGYRGYKIEKGALRKLAEKTGGRAFFPRGDEELGAAFSQIQAELRSQYLIAYTPKNRARDGSYRKVKIEVVNPELWQRKLLLLHRQGYYAKLN
jgi:Ca-activated chloride channel homolog